MQRQIEWTAGTGQRIVVTVAADFDVDLQGRRRSSGRKVVTLTATIDGREVSTIGGLQVLDGHPQVAAKLGKIGLVPVNYERVRAAIAECETAIAEHNAACDAHARDLADVDAGRERIERAMRHGE